MAINFSSSVGTPNTRVEVSSSGDVVTSAVRLYPTLACPGPDLSSWVHTDDGLSVGTGHGRELSFDFHPLAESTSTPIHFTSASDAPHGTVFTYRELFAGAVGFVPALSGPIINLTSRIASPYMLGTADGNAAENTWHLFPAKARPTPNTAGVVDAEDGTVGGSADVGGLAFDLVPPITVEAPDVASSVHSPYVASTNAYLSQLAVYFLPIKLHSDVFCALGLCRKCVTCATLALLLIHYSLLRIIDSLFKVSKKILFAEP